MRVFSYILLFIFVAFLSTPTIVKLIDKKCDISMFYGNTLEEEHPHKEVKKIFVYYNNFLDAYFLLLEKNKSGLILSENLSKHDNVSAAIFDPPPNVHNILLKLFL